MNRSPFSFKGLLIGAAMSLAVGLAAPYGLAFTYFRMGFNPSSQGAIFFFLVLLVVNILFGLVRRHFTLSRADLVLVYCMLLMAVTAPTWGLMFFLLGTMVYPYYYATPENRYAELIHDHIPTWMVPQDMQAIMYYYEGLRLRQTGRPGRTLHRHLPRRLPPGARRQLVLPQLPGTCCRAIDDGGRRGGRPHLPGE